AAAPGASQFPSLVIAIGITSYFDLFIAAITAAAERIETSCSPERPPKTTPMRSFFGILRCEQDFSQLQKIRTYRIVLPRAARITSLHGAAVGLWTPGVVLLSASPSERMPPAAASFSTAKCASR